MPHYTPNAPMYYDPNTGQFYPLYQQSNYPFSCQQMPTMPPYAQMQLAPQAYAPHNAMQANFYHQHQYQYRQAPNYPTQRPFRPLQPGNSNFNNESFYQIGTKIIKEGNRNIATQQAMALIQQFEYHFAQVDFKQTLTSKNYANIALIIGKLVQKGILKPSDCSSFITDLTNELTQRVGRSDRPTQAIANFIYGLGLLSQKGLVIQADFSPLVPTFIEQMGRSDRPTQEIANFIYGLGLLSQKSMTSQIDLSMLLDEFKKKLTSISISQDKKSIAYLYVGIELLKQSNQLPEELYQQYLNQKCNLISKLSEKQDAEDEFNEINALITAELNSFRESSTHQQTLETSQLIQSMGLFSEARATGPKAHSALPSNANLLS